MSATRSLGNEASSTGWGTTSRRAEAFTVQARGDGGIGAGVLVEEKADASHRRLSMAMSTQVKRADGRVQVPSNLKPVDRSETDGRIDFLILAPGSRKAFELQQRYALEHGLPVEAENGAGMRFRLIPPGTFQMGSEARNESPVRTVNIRYHFWLAAHPLTCGQYESVSGGVLQPLAGSRDSFPMAPIDWVESRCFCRRLAALEDVPADHYRWPTEAEWEYACRAGTETDYAGEMSAMCWSKETCQSFRQSVCQKLPNAFGLFDMHGNVFEWCQDAWSRDYHSGPCDGSAYHGDGVSSARVCRGGMAAWGIAYCTSSSRQGFTAGSPPSGVGFRPAYVPAGSP